MAYFINNFLYKFLCTYFRKIFIKSNKLNAKIITTEKDYLRIDKSKSENIGFIKSEVKIIEESKIINILINKNEKNKSLDIKIVNYKVLNKTGDMAIIISKLKEIRDHKISKIKEKKPSNKIKQEIRKLNETIALAEDLFKKELLNL